MSSDLEKFEETLNQLTEFRSYFTDQIKVNQLAEWLQKETGIPKPAARIVIKHIAPFVLAQFTKTTKQVGSTWLLHLHERLQKYSVYYWPTHTLLEILLARTSTLQNIDTALTIPEAQNLDVLLKDEKQWKRLKSDEKGFIQLLSAQNQLNQNQDILFVQIRKLLELFTFNLELKTPEDFEQITRGALPGSALLLKP